MLSFKSDSDTTGLPYRGGKTESEKVAEKNRKAMNGPKSTPGCRAWG
jgi:hypothetical protein